MRTTVAACCALSIAFFAGDVDLRADVTLPSLFSSNMILQRGMSVPIWGWADPGEEIAVSLGPHHIATSADASGHWRVSFPPLEVSPAGSSYKLNVVGKNTIQLTNVLVGEVWICAGQSNMEMPLGTIGTAWGKGIYNSELEVAGARYPEIRLFTVWKHTPLEPEVQCLGQWSECDPQSAYSFPAVAYFFARRLYRTLNIPIGLIHIAYAGVPIESCMRPSVLSAIPDYTPSVTGTERLAKEWKIRQAAHKTAWEDWDTRLAADAAKGGSLGWAELSCNDTDWESAEASRLPNSIQLLDLTGPVRLRKPVNIPRYWGGRDVRLQLGSGARAVYFNGVKLPPLQNDKATAQFRIPAAVVKPNANVLALLIPADCISGMFSAVADAKLSLAVGPDADPIPLTGRWYYRQALDSEELPERPEPPPDYYPPLDSSVYNGMVSPLVPFAIRGIIWYQGESNVERAHEYGVLFPALISDWRKQWGQGPFSFYYAQIANSANDVNDAAAELREAQSMAMKLPNTGMAVTLDIGESGGHPRNKLDVGERLALWALSKDYGQKVRSSGPRYVSMEVEGSNIRLHFEDVGLGLVVRGSSLAEFKVAGVDKAFHEGTAEIDGDGVVVHSESVMEPVAVRYAWSNVVEQLTLFNRDGLPAPPFRTDDWPGATFGKTKPGWWKQ